MLLAAINLLDIYYKIRIKKELEVFYVKIVLAKK